MTTRTEGGRVSDDPAGNAIESLRQTVALMTTNVAVLTEATRDLKAELQRIREQAVTRVEHNALKDVVAEQRKILDGHSQAFARIAWFVGLVVLGAVLGLVVTSGGGVGG